MKITDDALLAAWHAVNDAGQGTEWGMPCDTPADAAKAEGAHSIREIDGQGTVVCIHRGEIVVVADSNGPWACHIGGRIND